MNGHPHAAFRSCRLCLGVRARAKQPISDRRRRPEMRRARHPARHTSPRDVSGNGRKAFIRSISL